MKVKLFYKGQIIESGADEIDDFWIRCPVCKEGRLIKGFNYPCSNLKCNVLIVDFDIDEPTQQR